MLYAFGSNGSGQLGLGPDVGDPRTPRLVRFVGRKMPSETLFVGEITRITAGGNHTIILDDQSLLLGLGNDEDGRCGHHSKESELPKFKFVDIVPSTTHTAATWSASAIADTQVGAVLTAGSGHNGELGLGREVTITKNWQALPNFCGARYRIVQLASCMAHTVAILTNGEVYGWGKGRKGQLGLPAEDVWSPRKIEGIPFAVVEAVCGKDFTCFFSSPAEGKLLVFGLGKNDRFGVKAKAPTEVPGWKQVAASWGSIYVLMDSGELVAWGRDDHGQLPPPGLPPIEMIAAGSEHCLAITKAGKVLAWGWGEHGNCGDPTDTNGDVKWRWNEIEVFGTVDRVFAGCATSFITTKERPISVRGG